MTPPLLSTAYLPPIEYIAVIAQNERISIEGWETYAKQTYRNRCTILSANGKLDLTIPVSRPFGNHTTTNKITISYAEPWHIRHWRAIEAAYSSSPYFLYYRDGLEKIMMAQEKCLLVFNQKILFFLLKSFHISTQIDITSDYARPEDETCDYRNSITPKQKSSVHIPPYSQVFNTKYTFQPNLSAIDLLFNMGPNAKQYLMNISLPYIAHPK